MISAKTASDDNKRIVEEIERRHILDNIVRQITNNSTDEDLSDLTQDLYLSLLLDDKLPNIFDKGQVGFYLARMVMNNIASSTSPYYRIYKRPRKISTPLNNDTLNIPDR